MANATLITGGAGFIGAHVALELLQAGDRVRVLDSLVPQVHGSETTWPSYLSTEVELVVADVRDPDEVAKAVGGVDRVVHLASRVGVGQSMYEIAEYTSANTGGTATLLQALLADPVERLVVASSMSVYGEGLYRDEEGHLVDDARRTRAQLVAGRFDPVDASGRPLTPVPTPETKPANLSSVYALNKYDQERLCLLYGEAYGTDVVALRFFNVYGPYQALSNPYTGALAIFASRLLNGRRPLIFEDGRQRRDFVSVADVARACRLALESGDGAGSVINIASGHSVTMTAVATEIARVLGRDDLEPEITGKYRAGDIRHCFADTRLAEDVLGFRAEVAFERGLTELAEWLSGQVAVDGVDAATAELASRGLTV